MAQNSPPGPSERIEGPLRSDGSAAPLGVRPASRQRPREQCAASSARGLAFPAPQASARDVWVLLTLPGGGAAAFTASALAEARERAVSLGLTAPSDSLPESAASALPLAN